MRLFLVVVMAIVGALVGLKVGLRTVTCAYPLPHHVPKYKDGISLRFAMVHDIIQERYPKHGRAYYAERNRLTRHAIEHEDARRPPHEVPTAAYFALKDDLGVGLERLGQHEEAIKLMRVKLSQQKAAGLKGRDLYATNANLGTFLILWQLELGFADLAAAKQRLKEGLLLIRESIADNPEAHYGREVWQAVLLEFLLASLDDPTLLTRFDMVGNSLEQNIGPREESCLTPHSGWGVFGWTRRAAEELKNGDNVDEYYRKEFRGEIRPVGADRGWESASKSEHKKPVPFDEPTLGIVGMWRYGGGANPHFALALGEIMLRVGQRYIAWCAYERALRLSETFSTDRDIRHRLVEHCRKRQLLIEQTLSSQESENLRPAFDVELKRGQEYQNAYQRFEQQQIDAGVDLNDPQFYDDLNDTQGSIASNVGPEDQYLAENDSIYIGEPKYPGRVVDFSVVLLFAGLSAFGTSCLLLLVAIIYRALIISNRSLGGGIRHY